MSLFIQKWHLHYYLFCNLFFYKTLSRLKWAENCLLLGECHQDLQSPFSLTNLIQCTLHKNMWIESQWLREMWNVFFRESAGRTNKYRLRWSCLRSPGNSNNNKIMETTAKLLLWNIMMFVQCVFVGALTSVATKTGSILCWN